MALVYGVLGRAIRIKLQCQFYPVSDNSSYLEV